MHDDPEALLDVRGGGVLLVDDERSRAEKLLDPLSALDVDVDWVGSLDHATARLECPRPPQVVVVRERIGGDPAEAWCQRVRSDVQLCDSSILVVLDGCSDRGIWADDYLRSPLEVSELRQATKRMLRSYAVRRNVSRRERRRAIRWLAGVLSHEVNNPLVAAIANIEDVWEHLTDCVAKGDDSEEMRETVDLVGGAMNYLDRIRRAERRLRDPQTLPRGDVERLSVDETLALLNDSLSVIEPSIDFSVRPESMREAVFDFALLTATVSAVVEAVVACGGRRCRVSLVFDRGRVAVVLEFFEVPALDPEALLTPRLVTDGSGPLAYDPGLSGVESAFGEEGGQIFAKPIPEGWRFGLTLPNLDDA